MAATSQRQQELYFDGPDDPTKTVRLHAQQIRILNVVRDGAWRTLQQIADATGDPTPSISAQLRHLRKRRFGSHVVEKRHVGGGLYQYRVLF
jgi:hypothetical protein